jgi:NAD(P)-dependent dehydrogenase (short-subunit alcohol dehydrogenase family)
MENVYNFNKRNVLITGAAGGIGIGLCRAFLDWGATVFALDRDAAGLDAFAASAKHPEALITATVDLTDLSATRQAVNGLTARAGPVDILINNAGAAAATALANLTEQSWQHDLALNLSAAYHCVEAVKMPMLERGRGVIVNIGTVNSLLALGHPAYSAAKAGLVSYTRSLAIEYGPRGIRANIICPGTVKTQAWNARAQKNPQIFDNLKKWYPLRDFPDPADIASAAGFLASDAARMITGVVLPVDAGLTAGNPVMAAELTLEPF